MTEVELAARVIRHLRAMRWDVHQEVEPFTGGGIADIVAVRPPLLWIIECKLVFGVSVIEQAIDWRSIGAAELVSIATLGSRRRSRRLFTDALRQHGIGWFMVRSHEGCDEWNYDVCEKLPPRIDRTARRTRVRGRMMDQLGEETRTFAPAGNANGKRWTPFQGTVKEIHRVLGDGPLTTRELVAAVRHHYNSDSTARTAIPQWIRTGAIPNVEAVAGRPMRWRLVGGDSA